MAKTPFYASGLRFSCKRCSACCRYESGHVFLSEKDLINLSDWLKMDYIDFTKTFCRWVTREQDREFLSLREKSNFDCIFWDFGCKVYNARPVQCRTFPFWQSVIATSGSWETAATGCPGINTGEIHDEKAVESYIAQQNKETLIERTRGDLDAY